MDKSGGLYHQGMKGMIGDWRREKTFTYHPLPITSSQLVGVRKHLSRY